MLHFDPNPMWLQRYEQFFKFKNNVKHKNLSPLLACNSKSIFPTSDSFPLIMSQIVIDGMRQVPCFHCFPFKWNHSTIHDSNLSKTECCIPQFFNIMAALVGHLTVKFNSIKFNSLGLLVIYLLFQIVSKSVLKFGLSSKAILIPISMGHFAWYRYTYV